jgi:hypothetical protein
MQALSFLGRTKTKPINVSKTRLSCLKIFRNRKVLSLGLFLGVVNYYPSFKGEKYNTMSLFREENQQDLNLNKLEKKASSSVIIIYSSENNEPVASGLLINEQGEFLTVSNIFYADDGARSSFDVSKYYAKVLGDPSENYKFSLQYNCEEENISILKMITPNNEKIAKLKQSIGLLPSVEKGQSCFVFSKNNKDLSTIDTGLVCENKITNLESKIDGHFTSAYNIVTNIPNKNTCAYGGPVFDFFGNIMGIMLPVDPKILGSHTVLMPATHLEAILEQYKHKKEVKRPYIGVSLKSGNSVKGAFIIKVNTGAPANQAGIRLGDTITAVNGIKITNADEFFKALGYRIGPIKLTLERDGKIREVDLISV